MFLPLYQQSYADVTLVISAQSASDFQAVVAGTRPRDRPNGFRLPVIGLQLGDQNLDIAYWAPRVMAGMASTFGILALALATMGLYSVMMYAVSQTYT